MYKPRMKKESIRSTTKQLKQIEKLFNYTVKQKGNIKKSER